ncbi:MAG: ScyD/ScyE family protein [Gemmatimonadota bacterium]|nr:ScyD/ScyE family protein [Gemmatimonadota bacterium]
MSFTAHKLPLLIAAAVAIAGCDSTTAPSPTLATAPLESRAPGGLVTPSVFATGLEYPRGLAWSPDGVLYVAEAGTAGTSFTTDAQCVQVLSPAGPYFNGPTSRISRIDRHGGRTTFASGFPSAINGFGDIQGVADIAFEHGRMFALLAGGGCSHGSPRVPASILHVGHSGSWSVAADLSAWQAGHPVAQPDPTSGREPDGSWYAMIHARGELIAVEPNHGEVVRANPFTGNISRVSDISATLGHQVPTVVAERHGSLYVSTLGLFPATQGTQKIFRITRGGGLKTVAEGFTAVLGLDFDRSGRLYVLETTSVSGFPTPGTGRVVRLDRRGRRVVIADGLFLPTALRFGPDGALYVSNKGFGPPQPGEILRYDVRDANHYDAAEDMEGGED